MAGIFKNLVNGKSVAIVGNLTPTTNLSNEIDNHDIVIRINNFYNYDSNLVGKKVDMIFMTPTERWKNMSPQERHEHIIREQQPIIFAVKHHKRLDYYTRINHLCNCKIYKFDQDMLMNSQIYTTGTAALQILSNCDNFTCDCYCFSFNDDWKSYINNYASHYKKYLSQEETKRTELFNILSKKSIINM